MNLVTPNVTLPTAALLPQAALWLLCTHSNACGAGWVFPACPYRWSETGQLLLALALRLGPGLVPLLRLLLHLC